MDHGWTDRQSGKTLYVAFSYGHTVRRKGVLRVCRIVIAAVQVADCGRNGHISSLQTAAGSTHHSHCREYKRNND